MSGKTILAGVLGGLAMMVANFVMHGLIMGETYTRYPDVFSQEATSPAWFTLVCVLIGIVLAILFARTRSAWARGLTGGLVFGFLVGMTHFFTNFFDSMVYEGFPYFLAWCHGGMDAIAFTVAGAVLGLVIKGD